MGPNQAEGDLSGKDRLPDDPGSAQHLEDQNPDPQAPLAEGKAEGLAPATEEYWYS